MPTPFLRPKIYRFDLVTNEYLGETRPTICPASLESDVLHFLVPGDCTGVEPPWRQPGQAAVWHGNSWEIVPDHRGETWWSGDVPVVVRDLGDPAAQGLTRERPAQPLAEVDPVSKRRAELISRLSEITSIGASHVALNQPVPKHIIDEQSEITEELRKIDEANKKKKVA